MYESKERLIKEYLGRRMSEERKKRKFSQEKMGELLNLGTSGQSAVSRFENGVGDAFWYSIALCTFLELDWGEIANEAYIDAEYAFRADIRKAARRQAASESRGDSASPGALAKT